VKCDVLVAGASPAGLMAAIAAARAGSCVMLLDRDLGSLHHAANTLFEGMAARSGIKIEDGSCRRSWMACASSGPGGTAVTVPAKGYFIDRQRFDDHHLRLAESSGVSLLCGVARAAKLDGNRRAVAVGEDQIEARVVVDASGIEGHPVTPGRARTDALSPGYRVGNGSRS